MKIIRQKDLSWFDRFTPLEKAADSCQQHEYATDDGDIKSPLLIGRERNSLTGFTYRKAVPITEKDFNHPGALFQIVRFPPRASIGEHWHKKTCELFFVESGRGFAVINKEKIDLAPGDILLCEPGDHHAFTNTGDEDLVLLDFKINAEEDDISWQSTPA